MLLSDKENETGACWRSGEMCRKHDIPAPPCTYVVLGSSIDVSSRMHYLVIFWVYWPTRTATSLGVYMNKKALPDFKAMIRFSTRLG